MRWRVSVGPFLLAMAACERPVQEYVDEVLSPDGRYRVVTGLRRGFNSTYTKFWLAPVDESDASQWELLLDWTREPHRVEWRSPSEVVLYGDPGYAPASDARRISWNDVEIVFLPQGL